MVSYLTMKIRPFYGPRYWGGYLGASRLMLLCVTLCPLINYPKTVKILALKGLNSRLTSHFSLRFHLAHYVCSALFIPYTLLPQYPTIQIIPVSVIFPVLVRLKFTHCLFFIYFFFTERSVLADLEKYVRGANILLLTILPTHFIKLFVNFCSIIFLLFSSTFFYKEVHFHFFHPIRFATEFAGVKETENICTSLLGVRVISRVRRNTKLL